MCLNNDIESAFLVVNEMKNIKEDINKVQRQHIFKALFLMEKNMNLISKGHTWDSIYNFCSFFGDKILKENELDIYSSLCVGYTTCLYDDNSSIDDVFDDIYSIQSSDYGVSKCFSFVRNLMMLLENADDKEYLNRHKDINSFRNKFYSYIKFLMKYSELRISIFNSGRITFDILDELLVLLNKMPSLYDDKQKSIILSVLIDHFDVVHNLENSNYSSKFKEYLHKFISDVVYVDEYDCEGVMKLLISDEGYKILRKSFELNFNMNVDRYLNEIINEIIKSNKFYKKCIVKNEKEMLHFCD